MAVNHGGRGRGRQVRTLKRGPGPPTTECALMAHGSPHPLRPLRAVAQDAQRVAVATREPLRAALERAGLDVVAESATARDLVSDAVRAAAAACILDADLPGDRDWALRTLRTALPEAALVLVGRSATDHDVTAALAAGATAYVTSPAAVGQAVTLALGGQSVVPRGTIARLARRARWLQPSAPSERAEGLTP